MYLSLYQKIVQHVKDMAGHQYYYFQKPIFGGFGYFTLYSIYGICVSPDDKVFAVDEQERWHPVDAEDIIVPELLTVVEREKHTVNAN